MSELSKLPELQVGLVDKQSLAWVIAYAEKPGRDYLHEKPDLRREELIAVAYDIGAASLYAATTFSPSANPVEAYNLYPSLPTEWLYNHRERLSRERESNFIAKCAKLPGMKFVKGRPVFDSQDLIDFGELSIQPGTNVPYSRGAAARTWNALLRAIHAPELERPEVSRLFASVLYAKVTVASDTELEAGDYVDLYTVNEVAPALLEAIRRGKLDPPKGPGQRLTELHARFLIDFLHAKLGAQ